MSNDLAQPEADSPGDEEDEVVPGMPGGRFKEVKIAAVRPENPAARWLLRSLRA